MLPNRPVEVLHGHSQIGQPRSGDGEDHSSTSGHSASQRICHLRGPLALSGWLPAWDLARRTMAPDEFAAIMRWVKQQMSANGVVADTLNGLRLSGERARALAQTLTRAGRSPALRRPLHRILRRMLPEVPWARVWVQTYAHWRILLPGDPVAPVPVHTDHGFGHSLDERNIWIAVTDAHGPGALHLWDLDKSLSWLSRASGVNGGHVPSGILHVGAALPPVDVDAGAALLFSPLHIHGARMPREAVRVSMDIRIIPRASAPPDYTFSPLLNE